MNSGAEALSAAEKKPLPAASAAAPGCDDIVAEIKRAIRNANQHKDAPDLPAVRPSVSDNGVEAVRAPVEPLSAPSRAVGATMNAGLHGRERKSKAELVSAVRLHCALQRRSMRMQYSDQKRFCAVCKHHKAKPACPWKVIGRPRPGLGGWRISMVREHTCAALQAWETPKRSNLRARDLVTLVRPLIREDPGITVHTVAAELRSRYGLECKYDLVHAARGLARTGPVTTGALEHSAPHGTHVGRKRPRDCDRERKPVLGEAPSSRGSTRDSHDEGTRRSNSRDTDSHDEGAVGSVPDTVSNAARQAAGGSLSSVGSGHGGEGARHGYVSSDYAAVKTGEPSGSHQEVEADRKYALPLPSLLAGVSSQRRLCSSCGQSGHYRSTCRRNPHRKPKRRATHHSFTVAALVRGEADGVIQSEWGRDVVARAAGALSGDNATSGANTE